MHPSLCFASSQTSTVQPTEENCWSYEVHVDVVIPVFDIFGGADTEDLQVMKGICTFFPENGTGYTFGVLPFDGMSMMQIASVQLLGQYSPDEVLRSKADMCYIYLFLQTDPLHRLSSH